MGLKAAEIAQRSDDANTDLRKAAREFLEAEDVNFVSAVRKRKSFLIELEYDEKSRPSIPAAMRRLVKSVYTDSFPIWAIRVGLAYDPSAQLAGGEQYATTVDLVVEGHKNPSPIELEENKIAVGKLECYLGPVIMIAPDVLPLKYMVEKTPIMLSSRSRSRDKGTHRVEDVGPAVIEAATKILLSHRRKDPDDEDAQALRIATSGRARKAAGALRELIFPRLGIATRMPSVRIEMFSRSR